MRSTTDVRAPAPRADDDLAFAPATRLLAALAAGEVSSVELLDLYLERIERHGARVNAVVTLDPDGARDAARRADDARARGSQLGALHGLPMTIKDSFMTAGMRTTAGAPELADFVPDRDATAVARLRAAGAVIFGKTNVPKWTADSQSYNEMFGATNNPWDVRRTPGGSSGGAAAALAAGETALEMGSDIAGSIRGPAHCSGVAGLRPSFGLVPQQGYVDGPAGWETDTDMTSIGPMGRSIDDLALGLDVIAGPSASAAAAWRLELPPPRASSPSDYRIAVTLEDPYCPIARDSHATLRRVVDALADASTQLDERPLPVSLGDADDLFSRMLGGATCLRPSDEEYAALERVANGAAADGDRVEVRRARAFTQSHRAWHGAFEARARMRACWADFFTRYDALLCPVTLTVAAPHKDGGGTTGRMVLGSEIDGRERSGWEEVVWASLSSVGGLPAVSVPVGRSSEGLPVGIQIVGPHLEDRTLLDVARHVEQVAGGFEKPPEM